MGADALHAFGRRTQGYQQLNDVAAQNEYLNNTWTILFASGFIFNSDKLKYQSRIDQMNAQYTLLHLPYGQRCTYPMTVQNAVDVLNQHKHDNKSKRKESNGMRQNPGQRMRNNGRRGINNNRNRNMNFAQNGNQTIACFVCGDPNHKAPECPHRFRPRDQWVRKDKYKDYQSTNGVQARGHQNVQVADRDAAEANNNEREHETAIVPATNRLWNFSQYGSDSLQESPTLHRNFVFNQINPAAMRTGLCIYGDSLFAKIAVG